MKIKFNPFIPIILAGIFLISCSKKDTNYEPVQLSAETQSRLDSVFGAAMKNYEIPGAIVAIWSPKGNYIKARGFSNLATGEPMKVENNFRIGSVTKTFTGTIVLQLVDDGKINLDSSLAFYLPQYRFPKANKITVRMLGNMTSGIYSYTSDPDWVQSNLANNWETIFPADSLIKVALRHPLDFEPGTKYSYSNTTPLILGLICEKVTGKSMRELFTEKIFRPYHLSSTFWPNNRYLPAPYSHGYCKMNSGSEFKDMTLLNPSYSGVSGNLVSNIYDLAKWVKMLGKGTLYSAGMNAERMKWTTGSSNSYGFALMNLAGSLDFLILGHGGAIWGYNTFAYYIPSKDFVIIVHVNYYSRGGEYPAQALGQDILGAL